MNMLKWIPFANTLGRFLLNIPNKLFTLFGSAMLGGTVILAALLKDKDLAVAVATVGSILGTTLISLYLPKIIYVAKAEELRREVSAAEERDRRKEAERRHQEAEKRCLEAECEIARLESMRINVEALKSIATLGLLEVSSKPTDFKPQVLGNEADETWYRKGYRDKYVGVMEIPFKVQLGIDLQRVRVWQDQDNRLLVSAITITSAMDASSSADWKLGEVRREFVKDKMFVGFEGNPTDPRTTPLCRAHEEQLRKRLKDGQDFQPFKAGVLRGAEQALRLLLSPLGKEICICQGENPKAQDLFSFLAGHDGRLSAQIEDLRKKVKPEQSGDADTTPS